MEEQLTTLLAAVAGGRRFWGRAPEDLAARPYVVLTLVSDVPDYTMAGPSGYRQSRVQADAYADTYREAKAIARDLRALLSGYSGGAIQAVFLDGERDLNDEDGVTTLFRVSQDFLIHHTL